MDHTLYAQVTVANLASITAAAAMVYGFSKDAAANLRQKDDVLNTTISGFLAGATAGLRSMCHPLRGIPEPSTLFLLVDPNST